MAQGLRWRRGYRSRLGLRFGSSGRPFLSIPRDGRLQAARFRAKRLHESTLCEQQGSCPGTEYAGALWECQVEYSECSAKWLVLIRSSIQAHHLITTGHADPARRRCSLCTEDPSHARPSGEAKSSSMLFRRRSSERRRLPCGSEYSSHTSMSCGLHLP